MHKSRLDLLQGLRPPLLGRDVALLSMLLCLYDGFSCGFVSLVLSAAFRGSSLLQGCDEQLSCELGA